jgi:ATP-dependent protease HslVU (ClpYQ) peptidase subunit
MLAEIDQGIAVPFSVVVSIVAALAGSVAYVFRMLSVSQERRVTEMARSNTRISEEVQAQWRAMDRGNRLNALRICASAHVSAELKNEAREIISEIDRESDQSKLRDKN